MAAPKCFECARWSVKSGCALEKENYWDFRACTLDEQNFMIPRIPKEEMCEDGGKMDQDSDGYI